MDEMQEKKLDEKDGVYDEDTEGLEEITFGKNQRGRWMKVQTSSGEEYTTTDQRVFWRMFRFLADETEYDPEELKELSQSEVTEVMTEAVKSTNKEFKVLHLDGDMVNIVSNKHKQIPRSDVIEAVEDAMEEVFGEEPEKDRWTSRMINYKMEEDLNEYVDGYFMVDLGSNSGLGRSTIKAKPKTKVTKNVFDDAPACLNWSNAWTDVDQVANIDTERFNVREKLDIQGLSTRTVHTQNKEMNKEIFVPIIEQFRDGIERLEEAIEDAVNHELTKDEMRAILSVYYINDVLPKYIIKEIMKKVKAETVWGLSQAISRVRTHGTEIFRTRKGDPFTSDLADNLERVSGEILSVTPMIEQIHDEVGEITTDVLVNPPEDYEAEDSNEIEEFEVDDIIKVEAEQ